MVFLNSEFLYMILCISCAHSISVQTELTNLIPVCIYLPSCRFWNCAEVSIVPKCEANSLRPTGDAVSTAGSTQPIEQLQSDKAIIAYWASWQWYDRKKFAEPWVFDYRKYTRVNWAFFQTNEEYRFLG